MRSWHFLTWREFPLLVDALLVTAQHRSVTTDTLPSARIAHGGAGRGCWSLRSHGVRSRSPPLPIRDITGRSQRASASPVCRRSDVTGWERVAGVHRSAALLREQPVHMSARSPSQIRTFFPVLGEITLVARPHPQRRHERQAEVGVENDRSQRFGESVEPPERG